MEKRVCIIGNHPMIVDVIRQYTELGFIIDQKLDIADLPNCIYDEYCIMFESSCSGSIVKDDERQLQELEDYATRISTETTHKIPCHLLLHNNTVLFLLRNHVLYKMIDTCFELHAFTIEDQWAKNIVCNIGITRNYPHMDRQPITVDSNQTIHLVIEGLTDMGESLAIHAALTCHYPNYTRDHRLRTRITIVDDKMSEKREAFILKYRHLMDNSYYRYIDANDIARQTFFHTPMYIGSRTDFVDIEWEFVTGNILSPSIQEKLNLWSHDNTQILTLALCQVNETDNINKALIIADAIQDPPVTIFIRTIAGNIVDQLRYSGSKKHQQLYPIGMKSCGYDISQPILKLAKRLHYFYLYSYQNKQLPTFMPPEDIEHCWQEIDSLKFRYSNLYNVLCIPTKIRSIGHDETDQSTFYALNIQEIALLAEVEHNRWNVERLILGFRPPTEAERKEIKESIEQYHQTGQGIDLKKQYKNKGIHYDICSFQELEKDRTGKNVKQYDYDLTTCIPLIIEGIQ